MNVVCVPPRFYHFDLIRDSSLTEQMSKVVEVTTSSITSCSLPSRRLTVSLLHIHTIEENLHQTG